MDLIANLRFVAGPRVKGFRPFWRWFQPLPKIFQQYPPIFFDDFWIDSKWEIIMPIFSVRIKLISYSKIHLHFDEISTWQKLEWTTVFSNRHKIYWVHFMGEDIGFDGLGNLAEISQNILLIILGENWYLHITMPLNLFHSNIKMAALCI